jgi:hypothetical protein
MGLNLSSAYGAVAQGSERRRAEKASLEELLFRRQLQQAQLAMQQQQMEQQAKQFDARLSADRNREGLDQMRFDAGLMRDDADRQARQDAGAAKERQMVNMTEFRRMATEGLAQGAEPTDVNRMVWSETGEQLPEGVSGLKKAATPANVGSFEDYVVRRFGDSPTAENITLARKDYMQADDRPRITVQTGGGGGLSPTQESNVINRLSQQWKAASGPAADIARQSKLMEVGMQAARRGDMAQGSQVVLVTFQKILDPPSVVRESEYMRSAAGQSLINRVKGALTQLSQGGAGLQLPELEKFAQLAQEAVRAQTGGYLASQKERIGKTADRYKIPRELVFEDFDFGGGEQPTTPEQPTATGGARPSASDLIKKYGSPR